ncbi:MAG: hypothetical protein RLZZ58_67 [Pseudomonadota bacterium]
MAVADPDESGQSPETPEARRRRAMQRVRDTIGPDTRPFTVLRRAFIGVYYDGFIHAGNLAYLALLALFPFFITAAAVASLLNQGDAGMRTVDAILKTMPVGVADVVRAPVIDVLNARSGPLLWLGALVGLWTVGSLIETIRDILRRAYGTRYARSFWHYRLGSIGLIIGAVVLMLASFSAQVLIIAVDQFVANAAPRLADWLHWLNLPRYVPLIGLFGALYVLFLSLTPVEYRGRHNPKWPGALLTSLWWVGTLLLLPVVLAQVFRYDLTYGSLAGVMVTLLFFYIVGLGLVMGAELNAALASAPDQKADPRKADDAT